MIKEFLSFIVVYLFNNILFVDCCNNNCSPKTSVMSLMQKRRIDIHFVRHGETTANRENILVR